MKILVTGTADFIGFLLSKKFLERDNGLMLEMN